MIHHVELRWQAQLAATKRLAIFVVFPSGRLPPPNLNNLQYQFLFLSQYPAVIERNAYAFRSTPWHPLNPVTVQKPIFPSAPLHHLAHSVKIFLPDLPSPRSLTKSSPASGTRMRQPRYSATLTLPSLRFLNQQNKFPCNARIVTTEHICNPLPWQEGYWIDTGKCTTTTGLTTSQGVRIVSTSRLGIVGDRKDGTRRRGREKQVGGVR